MERARTDGSVEYTVAKWEFHNVRPREANVSNSLFFEKSKSLTQHPDGQINAKDGPVLRRDPAAVGCGSACNIQDWSANSRESVGNEIGDALNGISFCAGQVKSELIP